MKMSQLYMPTLREVPAEAEIPSHQLLLRAGMIRKSASGIYSYLPLGYRVVQKVEQIVREEMNASGSNELLMSILQPREIWEQSGRWQTFGPEMYKLTDRHEQQFSLGPTAEEYFTSLVRDEVRSYKELPLNLYQIQWKYRDEKRPRFGINRSREFLMKDAYSFDKDEEGMKASYEIMWKAYERVFDRLHLDYRVVQGDSGAMGGNESHEFTALSEIGEGVITYCNHCDYAATDEKATMKREVLSHEQDLLEIEKVHTPEVKSIEEVSEFLSVDKSDTVKTVCFMANEEPLFVVLPGHRELNVSKLVSHLKLPEHELVMMTDEQIEKYTGAKAGSIGPVGLSKDVRILCDSYIQSMNNFVCGANETDYHYKNVNYGRDFEAEIVEDLWMVEPGDSCPVCGSPLEFARGIEVGNIFQLGTKYSDTLNATFLDENGKAQPFIMGSYGIGITRTVSAIIEQNNDEKGIVWPIVAAPFEAIVTIVNIKDEQQVSLATEIYESLKKNGVDVLLDDRKERAGVKFNDRDLIGIPLRITVGKKANENIVEYSTRVDMENNELLSNESIELVLEAVRNK